MSTSRLSTRIREQALPGPVAGKFHEELLRIAAVEGPAAAIEVALINRLVVGGEGFEPAPFDSLWSCSRIFIEACIYVAVAEGGYSVAKARHVSGLAHRLGFSARQLSELERNVMGGLAERARARSASDAL